MLKSHLSVASTTIERPTGRHKLKDKARRYLAGGEDGFDYIRTVPVHWWRSPRETYASRAIRPIADCQASHLHGVIAQTSLTIPLDVRSIWHDLISAIGQVVTRIVRVGPSDKIKESTVWLSFDLGVRGDYENLYGWLDSHAAKECGDSVAVFRYAWKEDLARELEAELSKAVKFDKRTRVYLIYRDRKMEKNRGKFIVGGRRASAWEGYRQEPSGDIDEDI